MSKDLISAKKKKKIIKTLGISDNCKSNCCDKYTKSEKKRCARCPMYDLIKKIAQEKLEDCRIEGLIDKKIDRLNYKT